MRLAPVLALVLAACGGVPRPAPDPAAAYEVAADGQHDVVVAVLVDDGTAIARETARTLLLADADHLRSRAALDPRIWLATEACRTAPVEAVDPTTLALRAGALWRCYRQAAVDLDAHPGHFGDGRRVVVLLLPVGGRSFATARTFDPARAVRHGSPLDGIVPLRPPVVYRAIGDGRATPARASVLLHELGHAWCGLADEYVDPFAELDDPAAIRLGQLLGAEVGSRLPPDLMGLLAPNVRLAGGWDRPLWTPRQPGPVEGDLRAVPGGLYLSTPFMRLEVYASGRWRPTIMATSADPTAPLGPYFAECLARTSSRPEP